MALTQEQLALRRGKITASMLPMLMGDDPDALLRLYREEIGEIEREPETYAMRLGSHNEPFVIGHQEKVTGHPITRRGEVVDHPTIPEFCCTLDGFRQFDNAVIEAKFLSPFWAREDYVPHYYPQVLAQMRCTGAARGIILAAQGTNEPVEYEITPDADYETVMWQRVADFKACLRTFTPPIPLPRVVPRDQWRSVDLSQDPPPNYAMAMRAALEIYEATRANADVHTQAGKDARALVPDDVNIVLAGTHKITRDTRGVLKITRVK